jgi:hypothetical protein
MIKKLFLLILLAFVWLNCANLAYAIPVSGGYFKDSEISVGNSFSASSLDFSLKDFSNNSLSSPLFNIGNMQPGSSSVQNVRIQKDGSLNFKYNINFVKTGGDDNLCNSLQLEAKLGGVIQYGGSLSGFNLTPEATIGSSGQDDWTFTLSLVSTDISLRNKICNFNLKIKGWQTNSDGTWGFSDEETLSNNVATGIWANLGSVVINEVMWMGSTISSADEWIELRNTTDNAIDIGQWTLENVKDNSDRTLMIPGGKSIPGHGYFLISNYTETSANSALNVSVDEVVNLSLLNSGNGNIVLKDRDGNIVDQAKGNSWPAGVNGSNNQSMERNDTPGDGLQASSWHTCSDLGCNDTTFWDSEGNNYGTPKAANRSGEIDLELHLATNLTGLSFKVTNISNFKKLTYALSYDSDASAQAVMGETDLNNQDEFVKDNILFGTCSTGGACVYQSGIKNLKLKVNLIDGNGTISTLEKDAL